MGMLVTGNELPYGNASVKGQQTLMPCLVKKQHRATFQQAWMNLLEPPSLERLSGVQSDAASGTPFNFVQHILFGY